MKKFFLIAVLSLSAFSFLRADLNIPGTKAVRVVNRISNIDDFPGYVFISAQTGFTGLSSQMCPVYLVAADGVISAGYYKFCSVSVYAVERNGIDLDRFDADGRFKDDESNPEGGPVSSSFLGLDPVLVIQDIEHHRSVSVTSPVTVVTHSYEVDLGAVKEKPDNSRVERNPLMFLYWSLPLLALAVMAAILVRRIRRRKS